MSVQWSVQRGRRAAVALAAAGAVAAGSLSLAGGATAEGRRLEAGWPNAGGSASMARLSAQAHGADLVLHGTAVRAAGVDVGEAGDSVGDFFHFEERYTRPGSRDVIGRSTVRCEAGIRLRTFTCLATFKIFGKGKIVVEGALFGERENRIPITGGTGDYAGVGGTFRPFDGPDGSSRLVFFFDR